MLRSHLHTFKILDMLQWLDPENWPNLFAACIFTNELRHHDERAFGAALRHLTTEKKAQSSGQVLACGMECVSVWLSERAQSDTVNAPTGARSLLMDSTMNSIVFRGINKFPSLDELPSLISSRSKSRKMSVESLFLQRKIGGFIVHVFSVDGVNLEVMSKHSLCGPHAEKARQILSSSCSRTEALASHLHRNQLAISGECVAIDFDNTHPVCETLYDNSILWFSMHHLNSRVECDVPFSRAVPVLAEFGLTCVPFQQLCVESGAAELVRVAKTASSWHHNNACGGGHSEGYVVVWEARHESVPDGAFPIRVKVKTARYSALRAMRSVILGESSRVVPSSCLTLRSLFSAWAADVLGLDRVALKARVRLVGIDKLMQAFEDYCSGVASLDGRAEKIRRLEHDGFSSVSAYYNAARVASGSTVLVFTGLPGSGKSTLRQLLVERALSLSGCSYSNIISLSRDALTAVVMKSKQSNAPLSRHQQRQLRKQVHDDCVRVFSMALQLAMTNPRKTLIIVDSCNADAAARRLWFGAVPSTFQTVCCSLEVTDARIACERACTRQDHPTLSGADLVEEAVYVIGKKMQAPGAAECDQLMNINTCDAGEAECVDRIAAAIGMREEATGTPCRAMSAEDVAALLLRRIEASHRTLRIPMLPGALDAIPRHKGKWAVHIVGHQTPWSASELLGVACREIAACIKSRSQSVAGNVKWVPGKLLQLRLDDAVAQPIDELSDMLQRALEKRFNLEEDASLANDDVTQPHITLSASKDAPETLRALHICDPQLHIKDEVALRVTSCTLDGSAICLSVGGLCANGLPVTMPSLDTLHITVGHVMSVTGQYSLELLGRSSAGEEKLQRKEKNFLAINFREPLLLSGIVVQTKLL